MKTLFSDLTVGTKVFYTGDMANIEGFGVVTAQYTTNWGSLVDLEIEGIETEDAPRIMRGISPLNFSGAGRRFILHSEYVAERNAKIEAMRAAR